MVALFFFGTIDSGGSTVILGRFTPKIGGRPPKEGVTPKFGGKTPKNGPFVCPSGPLDTRVWMPSTVTHCQSRSNLGGSYTRRPSQTPHFGRFSVVAVVEKFRSRIRILQFSTPKITPHGCVYVSSARPPIVLFLSLVISWLAAEPIWGSSMLRLRLPHPFSSTPTAGHSGSGVFDANSL